MATTTYGTEYVQSSDLVSNWPGSSLSVANRIDNVSLVGNGVNNQTGTTYTLVLADGGKLVTFSNAAAVSLTVPTNASVAFPTGVRIKLTNKGAGTVTVAGAGGVTLNGNQLTIEQNRSAQLYKLDTNTWVMTADPTVPSNPGLVFITASTFSGSSAVNVNNCFTSTYENYRITISLTASAAGEVDVRLRSSGTDLTSAVYTSGYTYITTTSGPTRANNNSASFAGMGFVGTANSLVAFDVNAPAIAANKSLAGVFGGGTYQGNAGGHIAQATAYDGFTFYLTAITITGTVRVYGYRDS